MKILNILFWSEFGGTEKVCVDLCNEMNNDHDLFLITNRKIDSVNHSIEQIIFDLGKNKFNLLFLKRFSKLINNINPDIIQLHNARVIELLQNAKPFLKRKYPLVATRHNPVLKKKFKHVDLGIAVSDEVYEYLNSKKRITIKNGIPFVEPKKIVLSDRFNIIAIGRLAPVKGFDLLIKALSNIDFDFNLIILGEGKEKNNLTDLIKELNLENKIELKGFVNNVQDYIYSSDLQVIASEEEGLSLTMIEAIFYSKLLIASNIANHIDIIGSDLLFERTELSLTEKLNNIYKNHEKYKLKFNEIKKNSKQYEISGVSEKYIEEYKKLIKKTNT